MTVSIHQPNFLPWLGFFDKIKRSDAFVVFDNVQYPRGKGHFGNRNKIKIDNNSKWLTVPVEGKSEMKNFNKTRFRSLAAKSIMGEIGFDIDVDSPAYEVTAVREDKMKTRSKNFTIESMKSDLERYKNSKDKSSYKYSDNEIAGFLHFLQIQEMSNHVRDIKMSTNVDTSKDGTSVEARARLAKLNNLAENVFEQDVVNQFKSETPIGAFFNSELQIDLLEGLLPFRNDRAIYSSIQGVIDSDEMKAVNADRNKRIRILLNDFNNYVFQNELRYFDADNMKSYRGYKISKSVPKDVKETPGFEYGLLIKDGTIYLNIPALKKQYATAEYNSNKYREIYICL